MTTTSEQIQEQYNVKKVLVPIEKELYRVELDNHVVIRVLEIEGIQYIDFRKFYAGKPTKQGIRFEKGKYNKLKDQLPDIL